MKKNFFKKLSFVLAMSMVVSTITPAGAFAATKKPKLNSVLETLYLGSGNDVQYDFNVKNTKKGWKYKWTSADKTIATINSKGIVSAVAPGTTKVSVIISKKGTEVAELKASVVVNDNIASLKITNTPAGDKLSVNKENAFSYSYATKSGSTAKTTSVVKWSVDKSDATISETGVFVAKKSGTYKVTAKAFESKDKTDVLASADYTVTVPAEIAKVAATGSNQIKVTFSSAVTAVDKEKFTVTNPTTTNKLLIKTVTLSDDKTVATVDLYDSLINGSSYNVEANVDGQTMKGEVKYSKGVPAKIVVSTTQYAEIGKDYYVKYNVFDENGVDITNDTAVAFSSTGNISNEGRVNLATSGEMQYVYVYYINPTTAATIKSDKITVSGVVSSGKDLVQYTLNADPAKLNTQDLDMFYQWNMKTAINLGDTKKDQYYVRFQYRDQYGNTKIAKVPGTPSCTTDQGITFTALDPSIFCIDAYTGRITPMSVGTGYFRIQMGSINIVKPITIREVGKVASIKVDNANLTVSDTGNLGIKNEDIGLKLNKAVLSAKMFNNYGDKIEDNDFVNYGLSYGSKLYVKVLQGPNLLTIDTKDGKKNAAPGTGEVLINRVKPYEIYANKEYNLAAVSGTQGGPVSLQIWNPDDQNMSCVVVVNVVAKDNNVTGFVVDGLKQLDINDNYDGNIYTESFASDFQLYSVNAAGYKVAKINDNQTKLTITGPDGAVVIGTDGAYAFDTTTDPKFKFKKGNYNIVATRNNLEQARLVFNVKDSGVAPTVAFARGNVVALGSTISTQSLQDMCTGLDGYKVIGFRYVSANSRAQVSAATNDTFTSTPITLNSYCDNNTSPEFATTTLYNVVLQVQGSNNRLFEITNLGRIDVK